MQALIERIRSVFLEMGFSEIEGDYVQSAGWNMDALFIPQSHPARTMQDTFYLNDPEKVEVAPEMLDYGLRCMNMDTIQEVKDGVWNSIKRKRKRAY